MGLAQINGNDVSLFANSQHAGVVAALQFCAVDRRHIEHLLRGDQRRVVVIAVVHDLSEVHLLEHI